MIVDRDDNYVKKQIKGSGIFNPRHDRIIPTESFVLPDDTVKTILKEEPDVIIVGFDLGSPLYNGADIIPIIDECSNAYIIVNSEDDNHFFSRTEIKGLIDGSAGRDSQELFKTIRRLLHY